MPICIIGVDVALVSDHTAIAIFEPPAQRDGRAILHHCAQLALGMPIKEQAQKVAAAVKVQRSKGYRCVVVVDTTGVGGAVVPEIREEVKGDAPVVPMVINGAQANRIDDGVWFTPKQLLVSTLQIAFEQQRLEIRNFTGRDELVTELHGFKMRTTDSGRVTYGNDLRQSKHDDRVLAVAIAATYASESGTFGGGVVTSTSARGQRVQGAQRSQSWFGHRGVSARQDAS